MATMIQAVSEDRLKRFRDRVDLFPYLLISGVLAVILVVYMFPLARTFYLAFTNSLLGNVGEYIGLENFIYIFEHDFLEVIKITAIWTFASVGGAMLIGMGGAILLNQDFPWRNYFMGIVLIPWAMPLALVGYIWLLMFIGEFGFVNKALFDPIPGFEPISWLGPDYALFSVIVARIWKATPFALIIYYARLKGIPQHYYDAAKIDGAGKWAQFRYITLPELTRVSVIIAILLTVWTTLVFDIVFVMTAGGPIDKTRIIPVDIYITMFGAGELGIASAKSVVTVLFLTVVTTIYWKIGDL